MAFPAPPPRTRAVSRAALLAAAVCSVAATTSGWRSLPAPGGTGWEALTFPRVERATRYEPGSDGKIAAVRADSRCSASALVHPLGLASDQQSRDLRLRWRWRVELPLPRHDETEKVGDDFAARVYVMFRYDPAHAGLLERAQRRIAARIFGRELPGRAINYVWSSSQAAGEVWPSPYTSQSWLVSRGTGPLPDWRAEEVHPAADYARIFGAPAPPIEAVALMSDSDDGCGRAVAWYGDFAVTTGAVEP